MTLQILLCFIFIISEVPVDTVSLASCSAGWFGSSCQYKCHCVNNQCDVDGKCTGGSTCVRGWFGPLCQYQDLARLNATTLHATLTDGDDATCSSVLTFSLTWLINYQVTWFRIVTQQSNSLQNMQLILNKTIIPTTHLIKVTDRVTDILCQTEILATDVSLNFGSTVALCSVYISGGRNVALKQNTSQSSDYTEAGVVRYSFMAVDGNTSGNFSHITCTHTAEHQPGSWRVIFSSTKSVNRYLLYNKNTERQRLKGFVLNSYNNAGTKLFEYRDTSSNDNVPIYTISSSSHGPVSYVNISVRDILTLCEVEIYGDNVCNTRNYGLECTKTCNCNDPTETCFVATGGCRSGCAAGYQGEGCIQLCDAISYGHNCEKKCSTNCLHGSCDVVNGYCPSCLPGKQGVFCDIDCNPTYFGTNCTQRCSPNCTNSLCDNVNGACKSCVDGKQGPFCEEKCNATYYGTNCSQRCSSNCLDSLCDNVNGACKSCVDGRQGTFCEQNCNPTYFGTNCTQRCSPNCTNSLCDNVNGACKSCVDGKQGPFCEEKCNATYYGTNCSQRCSSNCLDSLCDNVNGACKSCVDGRQGTFCEQNCNATYYGVHCASKCSTNCTDQFCNNFNGSCLNCIEGKQGEFCNTDCDAGHYGPSCLNKCSSLCLDSKCDAVNGHCFRCKDNSSGKFCEKENVNGYNNGYIKGLGHGVGIGIGGMCIIVLIVTAVACVIRRYKGDKSEESKNRNDVYDQPVELQHTHLSANSITEPEQRTIYNNIDDLMAGTNTENKSQDSTYNTLNDEYNDVSRYMSFSST
ncbi:multiple epidermal growth factor-like domains protein 6 isoform X2 [Physella acuta]|uniref:multiple epidermal growth factor-like domains protein 6 isoform X2 n=1 Tax=Physella acuta TaxID=109671 RepID=UPI0027DB88CB|nr:multiple epidermal growth factor-like domains protein 6 isoform X2 [Physella acuta]